MSKTEASPPAPARRRSRFWLYFPYVVLLVLGAGLSAFWFIARDRVEAAVDGWLAHEAREGREWSCPNRVISGFPTRFEVRCERPAFAGVVDGARVSGEMGGFLAVARIYDPNLVGFNFTGPLVVRDGDSGLAARVDWRGFSMSVRRTADSFSRASASVLKPVVDLLGPDGAETRVGEARAWEAHLRPDPSASASDDMWDVAAQLADASLPALNGFFGDSRPLTVEFQGTVSHARLLRSGLGPQALDRWRDAGGAIGVKLLKLARGDQVVEARGQLGLDGERRPAGRLTVQAAGVGPLLQRVLAGAGGGLAAGLG
ncbi:DUF2125 domain-containing protein [Camelimonas abortus]|uniref:DUF2125 domain-containing protein n=2 Tax=Camelimonas abortus TaxID=1017184 RepID=A0ABV7LHL9_9HYPH